MSTLIFGSACASIIIGVVVGIGFAFGSADRSRDYSKTVMIGIGSALVGWLLGALIPMLDGYKFFGVVGFALIASIVGSHTYWAAIKRKSQVMKHLETDWPQGTHSSEHMPSTPNQRFSDSAFSAPHGPK